jgi:polysaccharide deacetylase 2 family uncharacterized protein YibQ
VRRSLRRLAFFKRGLAVAGVALALLVVALIVPRLNEERRDKEIGRGTPAGRNRAAAPGKHEPAARNIAARPRRPARLPQPLPPKPSLAAPHDSRSAAAGFPGPRAAIVIDDLGQNLSHLEHLAGLNIPLSIAVIPGLPATARTVSEASRRGIEMLLHQPMEPREEGGKNPGAGVLLTSMAREALRAQVRANLEAVPGAVGVNNHMGSRFTEDDAGLEALMAEIKEHGLFWLDSRTTAGTRGVEVARAAGVPALERDIFIDAEVNSDFIRRQVRKLIETARVHGTAVGIGHPHPETIAVLRELRGELLASGVTLVPVSTLVQSNPVGGPGAALAAALTSPAGTSAAPAANPKTATP